MDELFGPDIAFFMCRWRGSVSSEKKSVGVQAASLTGLEVHVRPGVAGKEGCPLQKLAWKS